MAGLAEGALVLLGLLFLLAAGVWVGISLLVAGLVALTLVDAQAGRIMATQAWATITAWSLTPLPLFILMGEILFRTEIAASLFRGLAPIMRLLPGKLLHVNIAAATLFSAVCGSSTATTAIVGRMAHTELLGLRYNKDLVLGSVVTASTLGILIPPSIVLIVYGAAADVSVPRLFIAGVIPGFLLALLFSLYIMAYAVVRPVQEQEQVAEERVPSWTLKDTLGIVPVLALILGMVTSIYTGIATATEAGAVGVGLALLLAAAQGRLTRASFTESVLGAAKVNCMIFFILAGAAVLNISMGFNGFPRALAETVGALNLTREMLIVLLLVLFLILGCFLDGLSIVVLSTTILLPMVKAAGVDPLWFGIFLVVVIEISMVTPPIGFNLFVLSGITGDSIGRIARAAFPFFLIMLLFAALITVFPKIVTFLPTLMMG